MRVIAHSKGQFLTKTLLGILVISSLVACNQAGDNFADDDKPDVVATSTIIADLAKNIGGEEIDLTSILQPGADPHVYEPVPRDTIHLEEAELILYNGYNLEPGLVKLIKAAGVKADKLAVGEVVEPLKLDKGGKTTVPDPHVWGDAENGIKMAIAIRDALIKISLEDKEKFTKNAEILIKRLEQLDDSITKRIATIPKEKRKLITTHDAFQYYGRAYNIPIAGTLIGISTEEKPSAQTVKKLVEEVKQTGVKAIFAETTINPTLITTVAAEAKVKLAPRELYSDSIGAPGSEGDSYIKMMQSNTKTIVEALKE